ncbi:MAG: hypothetical protein KA533_01510 [Sphingobium sp.]|nr:hypothetical protein [Sphingobium sp.]
MACPNLTPSGEAKRERQEANFLRQKSDKRVRGTFEFMPGQSTNFDSEFRDGMILGADGRRYRVSIPNEINCGFPYYFLKDGDSGFFYLEKSEVPEDDDLVDGFIDNYDYVHFRSAQRD